MKKIISIIVLFIIIVGLYLLYQREQKIQTTQVFLMDTIVELQAQGSPDQATTGIKNAVEELKRIDQKFGYQESLIDRLNINHEIKDKELYNLIQMAMDINGTSKGAFSLTLRPILDAWGFTGTHPFRIPTDQEINEWKHLPGEKGIFLNDDGTTITTTDGLRLDLAGITKGYAVDNAAKIMLSSGIKTGLVNAGGDIITFGDRIWRIGIKNPRGPGIIATIPIKNKAIATSGDYERFIMDKGKRYCHILDPSSGFSPDTYISSTIIADNCTQAVSWAKVLFLKGVDEFKGELEKRGMDWILIDAKGKVYSSPALKSYCPAQIEVSPSNK